MAKLSLIACCQAPSRATTDKVVLFDTSRQRVRPICALMKADWPRAWASSLRLRIIAASRSSR